MKYLELDGERMISAQLVHQCLAAQLDFPAYYGGNLDALWDVLSTVSEPTQIKIINAAKLAENLGEYGDVLLNLMREASDFNDKIKLEIFL
ncbi:MAG: barstar family protein [Syntrophomonas sp.]|nr:barstar family protein [Syntrophomonas sp.]